MIADGLTILGEEGVDNAPTTFSITDEENQTILQKLDREVHWLTFLYDSYIHLHDVLISLYTEAAVDTDYYIEVS